MGLAVLSFDRYIFCNSTLLRAILILTLSQQQLREALSVILFPLHSEGAEPLRLEAEQKAVNRCWQLSRPGHWRRGAAAWNTSWISCLAATTRWMSEIVEEEQEGKKMMRRESPVTTKAFSSSA